MNQNESNLLKEARHSAKLMEQARKNPVPLEEALEILATTEKSLH